MNTDAIRKFIKKYAYNIDQKQLDFVYQRYLVEEGFNSVKTLTELFYLSGVDPLKYTSIVPIAYAKESDKVNSVLIPSNIEAISIEAFKDSNLRYITFSTPSKCIFIDSSAFLGTPLKKIDIPDGMREIGVSAFQGCTELTEVSFPNTPGLKLLTGIFEDCPKLTAIQYRGTAREYSQNVSGSTWEVGSSLKYIECYDQDIKI